MTSQPYASPATCVAFCILTTIAGAQISDSSFEFSSPGNPPGAAWTVVAGTAVIEGTANATAFFPTHGDEYLRMDAGGISGAGVTVGYGPHTFGVAQVKQTFVTPSFYDIGISIDWEFVLTETIGSSYNDFASIDIIDMGGGLVANVLFVNSGYSGGTPPPPFTNVPGAGAGSIAWVPNQTIFATQIDGNPAPAGFKRAYVDLSSLLLPGTAYSLEITVANAVDAVSAPTLLVDNVRLLVGQKNQSNGSLRILGSSHVDGTDFGGDWGSDLNQIGPYEFYTENGARIAFRARSFVEDTPWALFAGPVQYTGTFLAGVGTVNLDIGSPAFATVIDGIAPGGGDDIIGTISFNVNFIEGQVAASTPPGTEVGYQALMLVPSASNPIVLSAATEVVVGGTGSAYGSSYHPRIPTATSNLNLGDDSFATIIFSNAGFNGFDFYGSSYTKCYVGSNGYVTFLSGDTSHLESGASMLSDEPRMALLWDDLNPSTTGNGSVEYAATAQTLTIAWNDVSEYTFIGSRNNFAVQLYDNDSFTFYYGSTSPDDGLVGVSPGYIFTSPNTENSNVDWSSSSYFGGSRGTVSFNTEKFERFRFADIAGLFRDKLDIATVRRIHFEPGPLGYTYFTGLR
jgi:hypothetical protein